MKIQQLTLRNFRNYEKASVSFAPNLNLIAGANAQGKTNLLESLVYLSLTRSHRISDDTALIRTDAPFAQIQCRYEDEIQKQIGAIIRPAGKTLMIQNQPVRKSSEFIGLLNVVLFAPDDLKIFTDQPRERRRVMNQEIAKVSSGYLTAMNRYQNLLHQRNILLKQMNVNLTYLDTLDEQMIQEELQIIQERRNFIEKINSRMPHFYQELAEGKETAGIRYLSCSSSPKEDLKQSLQKMMRDSRQKDLESRMTGSGIHREDLSFELNGKNVILSGSQGQKRMLLMAFKLSLLEFIRDTSGKTPVLLLDDVLSELDLNHQKKLIDLIQKPYQCLITAAVIPDFLKELNPAMYWIENGTIHTQEVSHE